MGFKVELVEDFRRYISIFRRVQSDSIIELKRIFSCRFAAISETPTGGSRSTLFQGSKMLFPTPRKRSQSRTTSNGRRFQNQ